MNKTPRRGSSKQKSAKDAPALPDVNPAATDHIDSDRGVPFQIVGIGASAGGIEALTALFSALSPDTGMAFVVVQHLDPTHGSMISEIIGRVTPLKTVTAEHNLRVEPDHVYIIPPNKNLVFGDGMLQLSPRTETRGQHRSVDHFLRSLAAEHGYKSIAVILSGMGSDGSLGVEDIKGAGGITFAQDNSAEHPSMPRSAIATGCIDMVMSPPDIAHELARIAVHPLLRQQHSQPQAGDAGEKQAFEDILHTLRDVIGVDFRNYKRNTLQRRIARRMVLHKHDDLARYAGYVQAHPGEAEALYGDILISVTSFFRDAEAYELLKLEVFPKVTADRSRHEPVRIWVLGCSTGEEAYSIAMAYAEFAESSARRVPAQIFATDLNGASIEKARAGIYAKGIEEDVTPERLRRFFVEVDGSYRIAKPIRDMCIFARQNVLSDPPFSRMDLVACRNVMIYLEPVLQQRLIPMLHYSLRNHGYLWLGTSESIGAYRDLFDPQDAKYKIFVKKPVSFVRGASSPATFERMPPAHAMLRANAVIPRETSISEHNREADRILLSRYAPPAVVLTRDLEILQFRGDTSPYLAPAAGRASLNVLKMLREGLVPAVSRSVETALRDATAVREEGLRVRSNGGYREVAIEVVPIKSVNHEDALLLLFHDANGPAEHAPATLPRIAESDAQQEIERLRADLAATREYLQAVIERQDAANEELQSANEEVQSANEELQSTNEELETSKEEIQSSNEELETVNDELQSRNQELTQLNNDLINLLSSAHLPIVIVGRDLVIRRITPAAEKTLNLIPADVGRPLSDVKLSSTIPGLEDLLLEVIDTVMLREREVETSDGRYFLLRARPYKTLDNKIDGAVLVFVDIDMAKRTDALVRESESRFNLLANSTPVLIWISGPKGLIYANDTAMEFFGVAEQELKRYDWTQFIHPDERATYMSQFLEKYQRYERFDAQLRLCRADGEYRWMHCVALPRSLGDQLLGYTVCCSDITELKEAESALHEADAVKNRFIAVLGHELRNPLGAVRNAVEAINLSKRDGNVTQRALEVIDRQTAHMVRIVDDMLDISRITHGKLTLDRSRIDVVAAVRQAIAATEHMRGAAGQSLQTQIPDGPIWVDADVVRLGQIFTNLLVNASKFTNAGGHIQVIVAPKAASAGMPALVAICVIDDGIGMNPALLDRMFELFVQGEMPSSSRAMGMGLGLPLTKQLVELHGGSIRAHSEGEGKGMTVEIKLPIVS